MVDYSSIIACIVHCVSSVVLNHLTLYEKSYSRVIVLVCIDEADLVLVLKKIEVLVLTKSIVYVGKKYRFHSLQRLGKTGKWTF